MGRKTPSAASANATTGVRCCEPPTTLGPTASLAM